MAAVTLEQFRASRRAVDDLSKETSEVDYPTPGYVYLEGYWIMRHPNDTAELIIGNGGDAGPESEVLAELEEMLYDFAKSNSGWDEPTHG